MTVRTMVEDNICRSRKPVSFAAELLAAVFILLASEVLSKDELVWLDYQEVAYTDVLKSKALIQTDMNQVYDGNAISFTHDQYPVYNGDSMKTIVFVWASEQETHAMRKCLYRDMKRIGKMGQNVIAILQPPPTFELCNRSVNATVFAFGVGRMGISVFFYLDDIENNGSFVAVPSMAFNTSDIFRPSVSSSMTVVSLNYVGSRVWTFVCNSLEFTRNKAGKLRQKFFSLVGNSAEIIAKSSRHGSASIILDFDVLALNESRIGLLNDSNVELSSLSALKVACVKLDQYGLNDETNEVIDMDAIGDYFVTTEAVIIEDKLRIHVNVSIPVISDHSFGSYACLTYCKLQQKESNSTISGCLQKKYFSVVLDKWRVENMLYRQQLEYCAKNVTHLDETCLATVKDISNATKVCLQQFNDVTELILKKVKEIKDWVFKVKLDIALREILIAAQYGILISTIGWSIIITITYVIYTSVRNELNIRRDAKLFIAMLSRMQEMENNDNRTMKCDVFLSYSSKDRPWVQSTLLKFIESKGFKVCFGEQDFPLGCSLLHSIEKSVFESRKAIAVLSPDYMKSGWCVEFEYALMLTKILNKEASYGSLLLIKYRDCEMLEHMKSFKYLDYTKAYGNNQSAVMKMLSYMFSFLQSNNADEIPDETEFFDDLLLWLGEPQVAHLQE